MGIWLAIIFYFVLVIMLRVWIEYWWKPKRSEFHFTKQGIRGPKYQFFIGNMKELASLSMIASSTPMSLSHNILPRVLSFYHHWRKTYGATFVIWFGSKPRVAISDPDIIREIFNLDAAADYFEKVESPPFVKNVEGGGLITLKDEKWAYHRRVIMPTFHLQNLKLMIPNIVSSIEKMLDEWTKMSSTSDDGKVEIEVSKWFENLAEDVITHTVFGSSYEKGRAIFQLQAQQMVHATQAYQKVFIPGYRFLPTKTNRLCWRLDKEIGKSLTELINERTTGTTFTRQKTSAESQQRPNDILQLMIHATGFKQPATNRSSSSLSSCSTIITADDMVEECKTMLFAGKHTTSNLLTWTTVLLAMHPHWQELAREEVFRVCGARDTPSKDHLHALQMIGMIVNESLRLYPPVVAIIRQAKVDVQLQGGQIIIPKGTELLIPVLAVHHDPELWGSNVNDFNPHRFVGGVGHVANHPIAFMPFGLGSRKCVGQNLALLQTKLAIAMILQRFSFQLASNYQHAPTVQMLLCPQYGAPVIFQKL